MNPRLRSIIIIIILIIIIISGRRHRHHQDATAATPPPQPPPPPPPAASTNKLVQAGLRIAFSSPLPTKSAVLRLARDPGCTLCPHSPVREAGDNSLALAHLLQHHSSTKPTTAALTEQRNDRNLQSRGVDLHGKHPNRTKKRMHRKQVLCKAITMEPNQANSTLQ